MTAGYNFETITVSTTAVGISDALVNPTDHASAGRAQQALITNNSSAASPDGDIRYRYDGTNPTTSSGHILRAGDSVRIEGYTNLFNLRMIRDGVSDVEVAVTVER